MSVSRHHHFPVIVSVPLFWGVWDKEHYSKAGQGIRVSIYGHNSCCMLSSVPEALRFIQSISLLSIYYLPF